jgi:hypothetical protein
LAVPEPLPEFLEGSRKAKGEWSGTVSSRPSDTGIGWSLSRSLRFSKGEGRSLSSPKGDLSPVECNFFRWIYPFITMSFFNLPKYRDYSTFHGSFLVNTYFRTRQNRFHRKGLPNGNPFLWKVQFFILQFCSKHRSVLLLANSPQ